jgi:predicted nucleic acid-binding protein
LSSDFRAILRRFKPDKRRVSLKPRPAAELPFIERNLHKPQKLLYDTTVYIDVLQSRFPQHAEYVLRSAEAWHSTVTEGELAVSCGLLSPSHPKSRASLEQIVSVIERRPAHRTLGPDREIWRTAGVLSGMLARLQGYGKQDTRRLLNDALLFLTAKKYGCTLLTRNVTDFDFLNQIEPVGQILFYRI